MKTELVTSDRNRIILLTRVSAAIDHDMENNNPIINGYAQRVNEVRAALAEAVKEVKEAIIVRRAQARVRDEQVQKLVRGVRDFWNVLQRRNARENLPETVLDYYHISFNNLPGANDRHGWVMLAGELLEGEEKAVEAGVAAMSNPSAADLAGYLEGTNEACNSVSVADRTLLGAQEVLQKLRETSHQLIRDIAATLRIGLSGKDASKRRRTMRNYGFSFSGDINSEVFQEPEPNESTPETSNPSAPEESAPEESAQSAVS